MQVDVNSDFFRKISDIPRFDERWCALFFRGLFDLSPGTVALVGTKRNGKRARAVVIRLLRATLGDKPLSPDRLRAMGRAFAHAGIMPLHLKIARGPAMKAAVDACPGLTLRDVAALGEAYDAIVGEMSRGLGQKPREPAQAMPSARPNMDWRFGGHTPADLCRPFVGYTPNGAWDRIAGPA